MGRDVLVVVGTVLTAAVWISAGWGGPTTATAVNDVGAALAAVVAAVACLRRGRRSAADRTAWQLLGAASALWAAGELLWSTWELLLGVEVPFPSVADVAYLAAVPVALAALLTFTSGTRPKRRARALLDAGLIGGAVLYVGWALALGPAWRGGQDSLVAHVVNLAYPVSDVAMLVVALLALQWARCQAALRLVALSFVLMAVADGAFTWLVNTDTYSSTNPIGVGWIASYLLIALAARRPDPTHDVASAQESPESVAAIMLPYAPFGAAMALVVPQLLAGRPIGPFLAVNVTVLLVLLLIRQAVTALDLRNSVVVLHQRDEELRRLAMRDPLTGLANRVQFAQDLDAAIAGSDGRTAVVYIDLDGFKEVNDRFGHGVGDDLLVEAARRLEACVEPGMVLARLGGDEFVVLTENGEQTAVALAQRILLACAAPFQADGETITFRASVGVAASGPDLDADEALRRADAAMYVAKSTGKGRAVLYPDTSLLVGPGRSA